MPTLVKRWALRHRGYRCGFVGVAICTVLFVVGFAAPAWRNTTGLWMNCSHSQKMCVSIPLYSIPAWFEIVRILESLSLVALLMCMAAEVYMDFRSQPSPDRRLVELLAMFAGSCGLVGSIIFAIYTPVTSSSNYHYEVYLSWGFGLSTAASCFLIAFATVIAFFRRKGILSSSYGNSDSVHYRASDGMVIPQGMDLGPPAYNEVVNQSSRGGGGQGSSGGGSGPSPSHPSHFAYFKPPTPPLDHQPPPAYYPPPPSGQFQAPPPYSTLPLPSPAAVSSAASSSASPAQPQGSHVPAEGSHAPSVVPPPADRTMTETVMEGQGGSGSAPPFSSEGGGVAGGDGGEPPQELEPGVMGGNPVVSSVPAYYVTVLGQMVPVFREELQLAGQDAPALGTLVPAYFIMTQGQHVPVYSEEQARTLSN